MPIQFVLVFWQKPCSVDGELNWEWNDSHIWAGNLTIQGPIPYAPDWALLPIKAQVVFGQSQASSSQSVSLPLDRPHSWD